jgi:hypothetical protein
MEFPRMESPCMEIPHMKSPHMESPRALCMELPLSQFRNCGPDKLKMVPAGRMRTGLALRDSSTDWFFAAC